MDAHDSHFIGRAANLRMLRENRVRAIDGSDVSVRAETICLHGDKPEAVAFAQKLRAKLVAAGITVCAPDILQSA